MDVVDNLERILKLILRGDHIKLKENTNRLNFITKPEKCSENIWKTSEDLTGEHLENILTSTELLLKIFSKMYDTGFDDVLEYIFHLIENLLYYAINNEAISAFSLNLFKIMELFVEVTVNHPCDKNVTTLKNFYNYNISNIKKIEKRDSGDVLPSVEELNMHLRFISIIYKTICRLKSVSSVVNERYSIQKIVNCIISENEESKFFVKIVCQHSDSLMIQTLIEIVPAFIETTENYEILQLMWEEVRYYYNIKNIEYSRIFIIFCYLSDFYFLAVNKTWMTIIFTDSIYWIILQNGLTHRNSTVRKEALFLMKKSLNFILEHNVNFYCYKKQVEASEEQAGIFKKLLLIHWDTAVEFNELMELCTIVEYLEEKQAHIVKPVFSTIEKFLISMREKKLDMSWSLIAIERMLNHDNMKIVRQGLSNLLKIKASCYYEKYLMKKSIKLLLTTLNCTKIYMGDLSTLLEELETYFENCSIEENGSEFFIILIKEMTEIQWSSEALFAVSYSLKCIRSKKFWKIEEINLIKKLITSGTANHYTYIKSGMHCHLLMAGINLIDINNVSLEDIEGLLNCFSRKTSLKRKTLLWNHVVKWIRSSYTVEDAQYFIISALGNRNIGKMMVLLYDAFVDDEKFLQEMKYFLKKNCTIFINIQNRPYCDKQFGESCLATVFTIMEETSGDFELWNFFEIIISDIILYIKQHLGCIRYMSDFQLANIYIKYISITLNNFKHHSLLLDVMNKWFNETATHIFCNDYPNETLPLQEFIKIKLLNLIIDYKTCDTSIIELYLRKKLNSSLIKSVEDSTLTGDLQILWGKMNSEFLHGKWELLSKIESSCSIILQVSSAEFILLCFEALDLCGSSILFPMLFVLRKELPSFLNESKLEELVDAIWRTLMERKKNEEFQNLMRLFVETLYQFEIIKYGNIQIQRILIDYSRRMLSENMASVAAILVKQIQKIGYLKEGIYFFHDFLPRALLFGQVIKKDERLLRDMNSIIEESELSPLTNDFSSGNIIRARSIQIVLTLNPSKEVDCRFAEDLIQALILLEEEISRNKTRYFSDSYIHRVKQRLLQTLLILEPYSTKVEYLWNWISQKILLENNQPSVRYLQEWFMLRIVHRDHSFLDSLWNYFDEDLEKRTGSLCSLITVIYHSHKCIADDQVANLIEKAVSTFLPYCMAQHFSVRLYAQVALQGLLYMAETLCLKNITKKYRVIMKSLKESVQRGKAVKNSTKIQEDFYFSVFNPVEHYSLQTIFYELPRLTNVNKDELISVDIFGKCGLTSNDYIIPLSNKEKSLLKFTCAKWILEISKQDGLMEESSTLNFQKKIIPVKCLMPDSENLFQSDSFFNKKIEKDGLVVVASLIDRIPNLGGLSRTCEVFGVSELVIGSLQYAEDKQFQSLSVTAEKWITITEVKSFNLSDYLIKMKQDGYTVLGAEQTINSQSLQSVKFPKKSVLLLGNEKEGIPPTLLPLMDKCIEIPQIGLIRSLNVHVTGALFIWEYAKQHNFSFLV